MKTLATLSLLIFTVIFTSCDETKKVIDVAGSVQLTGNYNITAINGKKIVNTTNPTLTFSAIDNSVRGTTGCNSLFGDFSLDLYAISFNNLAVSEKMCMDKNTMKTERDFLDALHNTGSYSIENNILTLYSKTDRSVLLKASEEINK